MEVGEPQSRRAAGKAWRAHRRVPPPPSPPPPPPPPLRRRPVAPTRWGPVSAGYAQAAPAHSSVHALRMHVHVHVLLFTPSTCASQPIVGLRLSNHRYDDGDDTMKKTIGEAMMKSRNGEAAEAQPHAQTMANVPPARSSSCGHPPLQKPARFLRAAPWAREESLLSGTCFLPKSHRFRCLHHPDLGAEHG